MQSPITLEAMHILDAIDRRGSFAAAANELDRAPSSLSYQIQKMEHDLDIVIFDRSGHKASFTAAGKLILERGRAILAATEKLVNDANVLANGWELDMTIAFDGIIPVDNFFPMVDALSLVSSTQVRLQEEILAGCWESLDAERCDLLVCPKPDSISLDVKSEVIGQISMIWVAAPTHFVHQRKGVFDENARAKYRVIAIADTAREQPALSVNVLHKQPRLTVSNVATKIEALTAGLGIGTLTHSVAKPLIEQGKLKEISGCEAFHVELILAWKRHQMGEAKSWCIKYLKNNWTLKG
ncbi:LysR family transcriptional regulator [Vibrio ostreicida]|uniref:LysR family transcriptional regulator n=1 Tax=Vibrio ostreicida TaxID=526588 RepID=A0ABT8BY49_9VIBR|nr:LysR family transcriptional regulator [Vibrio ostreicida]MDN3611619.1 LysR family transcriptional regulator [Vibrio ostreicida]NPD09109.1 LysR family transcriptional regulator [Vibrio ostreicida]